MNRPEQDPALDHIGQLLTRLAMRRHESRRARVWRKIKTGAFEIFRLSLVFFVAWALEAWGMMLLVGIAHRDWWSFIPVMGFSAASAIAGITIVFICIGALFKGICQGIGILDD